jgi:hypothetical protein
MQEQLSKIEENTRYVWQVTGANGEETIFGFTKMSMLYLKTIQDTLWQPVVPLLNGISGSLDDILTTLKTGITVAGIVATSPTGAGGPNPQTYSTSTGASVPATYNQTLAAPTDALLAQLQAEIAAQQGVVSKAQANLDAITALYQAGKATQTQVNEAQQQLKDSQDQLAAIQKQLLDANQQYITSVTGAADATTSLSSSASAASTSTADLATNAQAASDAQKQAALSATITWAEQILPLLKDGATISNDALSAIQQVAPQLAAAAGGGYKTFEQELLNLIDSQLVKTITPAAASVSAAAGSLQTASGQLATASTAIGDAGMNIGQDIIGTAAVLQAAGGAVGQAMNNLIAMVPQALTPASQPSSPGPVNGIGLSGGGVTITPVQPFSFSGSAGGTANPSAGVASDGARTGGITINNNLQVSGSVVGQNGMQQLSDMLTAATVTKLRQVAGLRISY